MLYCTVVLQEVCIVSRCCSSGGLFEDDEDPTTENAFRYGIHSVNADHNMLKETILAYDIQHLPARNSFIGSKKGLCS